ncbi:MAG: hypothetical protein Q9213_007270 [Squamulea squamosa]
MYAVLYAKTKGLARQDIPHSSFPALTPEAVDEVHHNIERFPERQILDFLVQFFVAEVNWLVIPSVHVHSERPTSLKISLTSASDRMDQLIHLPWFLAKYERWWMVERVKLVAEVDVAILILRICSYASQFLPSPGYTLDKIRLVSLADVRKTCDGTADSLAAISAAADSRGSLIRIQHLAFLGLRCQIEGNTTAFWEVLSRAIRVAQTIGIHSEVTRSRQGMDEIDQEMERRTFCNLYIWDSLLSRQLDHTAFLPRSLRSGNLPQFGVLKNGGGEVSIGQGPDAPDPFTERLLQARLADFWRSTGPLQGAEYDMVVGEERYDKFCCEYLSQLPPAFALVELDKRWDKRLPKLPMQRQLLHIAIYDSVCWNFRPLLLLHDHEHMESLPLPTYKRVLLGSQEKALAVAALRAIDGVTQLHALLGGCHTRFAGLVFSTFEAAVVLMYLCMDPMFPRDYYHRNIPPQNPLNTDTDPLQAGICNVTRHGCVQAVQGALERLRMLAEVSSMAETGASTLTRLLNKVSEISTRMGTGTGTGTNDFALSQDQEVGNNTTTITQLRSTSAAGEIASWLANEQGDLRSMKDFISINETSTVGDMMNWPSFDPLKMDSQNDFMTIHTMQDMQSNCTTSSIMDSSH